MKLLVAITMLLASFSQNLLAENEPVKHNIVIVTPDDLAYGDYGCLGTPTLKTPSVDHFIKESLLATKFRLSPTCPPTCAALLSDRYEFRNGVTHTILERERMSLGTVTMPQMLKTAGYSTGIFGKWYLGDEEVYRPESRGFSEVYDFQSDPGETKITTQEKGKQKNIKPKQKSNTNNSAADNAPKQGSKYGNFEPTRLVTYKQIGEVDLKLHIFEPAGHQTTDRSPVAVFFFGGGWNGGTPQQFYPHCSHLAAKGVVAMSAEYRVKKRNKTTPVECVKDGKSAIRWIRKHANELGVDPDKLIAGGGSAGGHVAAATGTATTFEEEVEAGIDCRPNAMVLFNPVFDNGPGGYGHERVKEYWQQFSPMHNIDAMTAPTIVFLGTKDHLVPVATAENYKQRMEKLGLRCELRLYKDQELSLIHI